MSKGPATTHSDRDADLPAPDTMTVVLPLQGSFEASNELAQQREVLGSTSPDREASNCRLEAQFTLFGMLPLEIRDAIWKFALEAPQIHRFYRKRTSQSAIKDILYVCREAHAQASKFLVARYMHGTVMEPRDEAYLICQEETIHFINIDIDTLLLLNEPMLSCRARWDFDIWCDGCHWTMQWDPDNEYRGDKGCAQNHQLNQLVILHRKWPEIEDFREAYDFDDISDRGIDALIALHPK